MKKHQKEKRGSDRCEANNITKPIEGKRQKGTNSVVLMRKRQKTALTNLAIDRRKTKGKGTHRCQRQRRKEKKKKQ